MSVLTSAFRPAGKQMTSHGDFGKRAIQKRLAAKRSGSAMVGNRV
jgi:hypothetical protein